MKNIFNLLKILSVILFISSLHAQTKIIKVWPIKIPGVIENAGIKEESLRLANGGLRISNVIDPTLTIFFPPKEKLNGTAVIICPGGGYGRLAIDHEGEDVAKWFNEFGVTGIVLKYRLPNSAIMKDKSIGPLQDVQESIRIVRRNSKAWGINPKKIGIIGFSAGGHLAATASTLFDDKIYDSDATSARPDFSILIYAVISMDTTLYHSGSRKNLLGDNPDKKLVDHFSNELNVKENTPPTFLVHAADDKTVPFQNSVYYFFAMKKMNIPGELHVYEKGGHGFGLAKNRGTESNWPEACKSWLKMRELL